MVVLLSPVGALWRLMSHFICKEKQMFFCFVLLIECVSVCVVHALLRIVSTQMGHFFLLYWIRKVYFSTVLFYDALFSREISCIVFIGFLTLFLFGTPPNRTLQTFRRISCVVTGLFETQRDDFRAFVSM